eukprot:g5035.t1
MTLHTAVDMDHDGKDVGFDTLCRRGMQPKPSAYQERRCAVTAPCEVDHISVRKVGFELMSALPPKLAQRGLYCRPLKNQKFIEQHISSEEVHVEKSKFKFICRKISCLAETGHRPGATPTIIAKKRKRRRTDSPIVEPVRLKYELKELRGITWIGVDED